MEARISARAISRTSASSRARLQLVLLALAAWNLVTFLLELASTALIDIERVDGVVGGHAVSGASAVLGIAYVYAARNPVRYRFIAWLALIEQVVALFSMAFHWARDDVSFGEVALPMVVATVFLVLLLTTLPRQTDTMTV
jgi:hypothetical protein